MLGDVGIQLFVADVGQHVDPQQVQTRVDCQHRADSAPTTVGSTQAANERIILAPHGIERFAFAHLTALLLAFRCEIQHPVPFSLLLHRKRWRERADLQTVLAGKAVASFKRFLEEHSGVDEHHGHRYRNVTDHVADDVA